MMYTLGVSMGDANEKRRATPYVDGTILYAVES